MGRWTRRALYFAILCGFWLTFKQLEPRLFPVVKNFTIETAVDNLSSVSIYGRFDKVRDCEFIGVIAYSGNTHISVVFPPYPVVSRLPREQTYGPWMLIPKTSHLELYSHHRCTTGIVRTKMFEGALVL